MLTSVHFARAFLYVTQETMSDEIPRRRVARNVFRFVSPAGRWGEGQYYCWKIWTQRLGHVSRTHWNSSRRGGECGRKRNARSACRRRETRVLCSTRASTWSYSKWSVVTVADMRIAYVMYNTRVDTRNKFSPANIQRAYAKRTGVCVNEAYFIILARRRTCVCVFCAAAAVFFFVFF